MRRRGRHELQGRFSKGPCTLSVTHQRSRFEDIVFSITLQPLNARHVFDPGPAPQVLRRRRWYAAAKPSAIPIRLKDPGSGNPTGSVVTVKLPLPMTVFPESMTSGTS